MKENYYIHGISESLYFSRIVTTVTRQPLMQVKLLGTHVQKSLCRRIHPLPHFEPSLYNGTIFSLHAVFIVQQDAKQNLSLSTCEILLVIRSEKQR